jgi:hypothetical protein
MFSFQHMHTTDASTLSTRCFVAEVFTTVPHKNNQTICYGVFSSPTFHFTFQGNNKVSFMQNDENGVISLSGIVDSKKCKEGDVYFAQLKQIF